MYHVGMACLYPLVLCVCVFMNELMRMHVKDMPYSTILYCVMLYYGVYYLILPQTKRYYVKEL